MIELRNTHKTPGRFCDLADITEITALAPGMDLRLPVYRREVFLRFYAFHLKFRIFPGCVYFALPYLRERLGVSQEDYLWFLYIQGNTQNPVTSWLIWRQFPRRNDTDPAKLAFWFNENHKRLSFDTDRRHWKYRFVDAVDAYQKYMNKGTQEEVFGAFFLGGSDPCSEVIAFAQMWNEVRENFLGYGRLTTWSYLEYLRIAGLRMQPNSLMLEDREGSRSHRNGLAKVTGRDDLDWHGSNPGFDGKYSEEVLEWLVVEGQALLNESRRRAEGKDYADDVNYLTLESALCSFKSCFRKNRRYPGVYCDLLHDRIKKAEAAWPGTDFSMFWEMRAKHLPTWLRQECNPNDVGCKPAKQNFFLESGQLPVIGFDDPAFECDYNYLLEGRT